LANTYVVNAPNHTHHNYGYYGQEPMSTMNSLNFNVVSNIHVNPYSLAISSQYVVPPQDMSMNERIDYDNANYLASCSQNLAPYTNVHAHNLASHVTPNSSRINENLASYANGHSHDSTSYVASNSSRINERWIHTYAETISKRPIMYESLAMSMKNEVLPIGTASKGRVDSDVSECSATKAEQYNILSESITS
jgi:hypothetical protein